VKHPRKSVSQKMKMLLQREIGSECPFCANQDVDHFQFHHIDEDPSHNELVNLLMLCPTCHSKITKGDIPQSEVDRVKQKLQSIAGGKPMSAKVININSKVRNAVIGDNNIVTINNTSKANAGKRVKENKYPDGCVGACLNKANYVGYLKDRYHEYKKWEMGTKKMNYVIFPSQLKKRYKIGKDRSLYHLPEAKFDELVVYMKKRIDSTMLGKINGAKGQDNYSSFEEYIKEAGM